MALVTDRNGQTYWQVDTPPAPQKGWPAPPQPGAPNKWLTPAPAPPWQGGAANTAGNGAPWGVPPVPPQPGHALAPYSYGHTGAIDVVPPVPVPPGHALTPNPNAYDPNRGSATPGDYGSPIPWGGGHPGPAHIFPTDTLGRSAYDLSPQLAWSTAAHYLSPNTASPRYDWVTSHAQQFGNEFADGQANGAVDRNQTLSQYIEQQAPTYMQRYDLQSPGQKGYSLGWQNSGRYTG